MTRYKYTGPQDLLSSCDLLGSKSFADSPCHNGCAGHIRFVCPFTGGIDPHPIPDFEKYFEVIEG